MDTHEVFNQTPPFGDVNLVATNQPLLDVLKANGVDPEAEGLIAFGAAWGIGGAARSRPARQREPAEAAHARCARLPDRRGRVPPGLSRAHAGQHGGRPPCLDLGRASRAAKPMRLARAARLYTAAGVESGHVCPITMTHASVAALAAAPNRLAEWLPKIRSRDYDSALHPVLGEDGRHPRHGDDGEAGRHGRPRQHDPRRCRGPATNMR